MAIGYVLTLGNCFSHSSSPKNILTLKRSFSFIVTWVLACSPTKSAWRGTWDHTATSPYGIPLLQGVHRSGCCQLLGWLRYQKAEQLLSWTISLILTTAESVKRTLADSLPRACTPAVLQSSTQLGDNSHYYSGGMQMSTELDAVQIHR